MKAPEFYRNPKKEAWAQELHRKYGFGPPDMAARKTAAKMTPEQMREQIRKNFL